MEAVIFIGIQASGKTTFYRERFFDTHVRISLDLLKTRHREQLFLRTCLESQQRFVVDNTNVLRSERAEFIRPAKTARFTVIGYFFKSELRAALGRNRHRPGKQAIPVPGVIAKYKRLQPPTLDEGFDVLYTVELTGNNEFTVGPYEPSSSTAEPQIMPEAPG